MQILASVTRFLDGMLAFVSGVALVSMVLLTCSNIFMRYMWSIPISGTFELMGFFGAVVTTFALGYTQRFRMHIAVTVLVDRFSSKTKTALTVLNDLLCMTFFVLVGWQTILMSNNFVEQGEVTETLQIVFYPFTYAVALGCLVLALVFLTQALQTMFVKKED
jgi:TRAP-type C4-dicarboxylate transport system permease small subunit